MGDLRSLWSHAAGLAWVAFRSFAGTMLLLTGYGLLMAGGAYYLLRDHPPYGLLVAALALAEALAVGVVFGGKRAVVTALADGARRLRLGRAVVRLLFERLLEVSAEEEFGERGGRITRTVERLPLAQAEKRLTEAVDGLVGSRPAGGPRGWLQRKLLGLVQKYTLARFREEGAQRGGVDLVLVRDDLEARIDDLLIAKLRGGLNLWTILVLVGLPTAVFVQAYVMLALLNAK